MAFNKVINSESQKFEPITTETLVLDAVPTVNSFNSVTSDAVARAVAGASGEVPQVTENDNGKVLQAVYDAGGPAVEWAEPAKELPDTASTNQGDVLTIDSQGDPSWEALPESCINIDPETMTDEDAQNAIDNMSKGLVRFRNPSTGSLLPLTKIAGSPSNIHTRQFNCGAVYNDGNGFAQIETLYVYWNPDSEDPTIGTWQAIPGQTIRLPEVPIYDSSTDAGKVLQVQVDGSLAWVTLS